MKSKKLFIPDSVLQMYGCLNCIWKSFGQCPHGLRERAEIYGKGNHVHSTASGRGKTIDKPIGYCMELADFMLSLSDDGDSVSAVQEKFLLYIQIMQSREDHAQYFEHLNELKELEQLPVPLDKDEAKEHNKKIYKKQMQVDSDKIWWSRLSDQSVKGLSKITDRESRSKDVETGAKKISVQQLNVLMKESRAVLEHDTKKEETKNNGNKN